MIGFPELLINSLSILIISAVIVATWKRRTDTCATQLLITSVFMLLWALGSFIEMLFGDISHKILLRNLTQIGAFGTPAAILMFTVSYTSILKKYSRQISVIIYSLQTFSVLLIVTDQWHHLLRAGVSVVNGTVLVKTTTLARLLISFNFLYMIISLLFLIAFLLTSSARAVKKQTLCVLAGMGISVIYSLLKVSSNEMFAVSIPISGIFAVADICMLFGIFRYDLLMLLPLARNEVFNIIGDGLIVATRSGKIIDFNNAAMSIFGDDNDNGDRGKAMLRMERNVGVFSPELFDAFSRCQSEHLTSLIKKHGDQNYYLCELYPIQSSNEPIGSIMVIKNITEQKRSTDLLKERAEKDGLTGIYNRETFIKKVERSLEDNNGESSLLYIDIDYFKEINDKHGHIFGDYVLTELCRLIREILKGDALMGRMGGEEFAIFIRAQHKNQPLEIADEIRRAISGHEFILNDCVVKISISIGGAYGRFSSFDRLYHTADVNLYKAKKAGRNTVVF